MLVLILAAAMAAAMQPAAAPAAAPPAKMICPIGGESFDHARPAPAVPTGMRPDGRPYGAGRFPAALPECPSNGLILYKDYDAREVETLTPIVASEEFQARRAADTPYYRAYQLMRALGEAPDDYLWALLQASWEAEGKPELRARYLSELAEAAAEIPARPADIQWIGMEARAINALRELGRFDDAAARLERFPLASLQPPLADIGRAIEAESVEARSRRGWVAYFKALEAAIAQRDDSAEPLGMIPRSVALGTCLLGGKSPGERQRSFCESDQVKAELERMRSSGAAAQAEADALRRSREEAGR